MQFSRPTSDHESRLGMHLLVCRQCDDAGIRSGVFGRYAPYYQLVLFLNELSVVYREELFVFVPRDVS